MVGILTMNESDLLIWIFWQDDLSVIKKNQEGEFMKYKSRLFSIGHDKITPNTYKQFIGYLLDKEEHLNLSKKDKREQNEKIIRNLSKEFT